jgi:transposase
MVLRSRNEYQAVLSTKMAGLRNLSGDRSQYGAFAVLEPCAVKVARTVLRGRWRRNALLLPADMPMPTGANKNEIEIITGVERRRRWSAQEKLQWVKRTMEPGMTVSLGAREAGITTSQLFQWSKTYTEGSLVAVGANEPVVPASDLQDAMKRICQLEAALGRKTLENEILKESVDFAEAKNVWSVPYLQDPLLLT